jgi:hypothetical protein
MHSKINNFDPLTHDYESSMAIRLGWELEFSTIIIPVQIYRAQLPAAIFR